MAPHPFDVEAAVTAAGDHRFHARTSPAWWGGTGPHGGHLAASVLRATMAEVGDDELSPRSFTIHFLRPADLGELSITTETVGRGRSLATVSAEMRIRARTNPPGASAAGVAGVSDVKKRLPSVTPTRLAGHHQVDDAQYREPRSQGRTFFGNARGAARHEALGGRHAADRSETLSTDAAPGLNSNFGREPGI